MTTYKAGAASVCITPNEPLWLAGYASRTAPAQGKISDLYASALALEDSSGQRIVIASMDLIAITPIIAELVIDQVRAGHGLAREQILLSATHTHYGPEFRPDKAPFFKIPDKFAAKLPAVAESLAASLTHAISLSLESLEPVRLYVRRASIDFAHNRRRHGVVAGTPSDEDVLDHDVPILDCVGADGRRKAVVFGYACHNTTIPPDDRHYCGDWAGFAKEQLQAAHPDTTVIFLPGAGADQDPEPSGSVELSRQHGRAMAETLARALDATGNEITGPIRAVFEELSIPLAPITREAIQGMLHSDDPPKRAKAKFLIEQIERGEPLITSYPVPIQVVRIGDELLLVALSGEPVVDWSLKLKQQLGNAATTPSCIWIAGYCNDMFGYLPTRRVQAEGGYEGGRANLWSWIPAPFTDDVEDRVTEALERLINRVMVSGDRT